MRYHAWFECISGCGEKYPLNTIIYECRKCKGLLRVSHDLEALRQKSAAEWKKIFDDRYLKTSWPYGSGVWGKKEWVCPEVEDDNVVSMYEGGTNLFWADRLGREIGLDDLWIKLCGNSHSGSFKDLGMTVLVSMVKQMRAEGKEIPAVACASTGDTSASLAAYCAAAGIPAIVFLPYKKISPAQLIQPISNNALTLALNTDFDGCMKLVRELCQRENIYLANSMNSLRIEGQKTVGIEITQQFDWEVPGWIIIPGGNLGNVSALGKGIRLMKDLGLINRLPRIVCAQSAQANPLYQSYLKGFSDFAPLRAKKTLASAIQIGNPVSVQKAINTLKEFDGIVEQATEQELADAAARADRTGLFNCPHTGVALSVLFKLVEQKKIGRGERVIVISTANGLKFTDFKIQYHQNKLKGISSPYANQPIELPAEYEVVKKAIFSNIEKFSS